jgi:hypothetical protein
VIRFSKHALERYQQRTRERRMLIPELLAAGRIQYHTPANIALAEGGPRPHAWLVVSDVTFPLVREGEGLRATTCMQRTASSCPAHLSREKARLARAERDYEIEVLTGEAA